MFLCLSAIRLCLLMKTMEDPDHVGTQIPRPSSLHPSTCTPPHTSAPPDPVSLCLTLTYGTRALYLATTCEGHFNWEDIRERSSSDNQVYETIWSLNEEETAYMVDAS